jgi:putative intracellular protease/amidase
MLDGGAHPMTILCQFLLLLLVLVPEIGPEPRAAEPPAPNAPRNCAILIFDDIQVLDFTGPYEVLNGAYDNGMMFRVYTVAAKAGPITTGGGMVVTPNFTIADCPKPDVLVLPGGGVERAMADPALLPWIKQASRDAEYTLSVCNGAFLLAKAGLLDGLEATTFHGLVDELQAQAPKCRVVRDRRVVDNGKIITAAGISSGIDGALHVVERIAGRGVAQSRALVMEYDWRPDSGYARASLADRHLTKVLGQNGFDIPEGTGWHVASHEGDARSWEKRWDVRTPMSAGALLEIVDAKLVEGWKRSGQKAAAGGVESRWSFADEKGAPWTAVATVRPAGAGAYTLSIRLARV